MAKHAQLIKTLSTSRQQSKTNSRIAAPKSSKINTNRKLVQADIRKGHGQRTGKIATIVAYLRRPRGANIDELMKATGWQAHSVRGAISGSIRKKHGLTVTSEKKGSVRLYRILDKAAG